MARNDRTRLLAAVEGAVDEAVLKRLARDAGVALETVHGRNGKAQLLESLPGYNNAAHHWPWLVVVDLDHDADCPPPALHKWLPRPAPHMNLRIAVREVEAWLMADREAFAQFLSVRVSQVPRAPEAVDYPKRAIVGLAQRSKRAVIRDDMAPRRGSGRLVGAGYTARLIEFAQDHWRPEVAAARAESLRRCIACLRRIAEAGS